MKYVFEVYLDKQTNSYKQSLASVFIYRKRNFTGTSYRNHLNAIGQYLLGRGYS